MLLRAVRSYRAHTWALRHFGECFDPVTVTCVCKQTSVVMSSLLSSDTCYVRNVRSYGNYLQTTQRLISSTAITSARSSLQTLHVDRRYPLVCSYVDAVQNSPYNSIAERNMVSLWACCVEQFALTGYFTGHFQRETKNVPFQKCRY